MSVALGLSIALGPAQSFGLPFSPTCPHTQGAFCRLPRKILSNFPLKSEAQTPWWDLAASRGVRTPAQSLEQSAQGLPALSFPDLYSSSRLLSGLGCGNHTYCVPPCLGEAVMNEELYW